MVWALGEIGGDRNGNCEECRVGSCLNNVLEGTEYRLRNVAMSGGVGGIYRRGGEREVRSRCES